MKFTLNNFYSNNYKDFVHLEALKNILRKVPQLKLAGVENIDNVLSMEFSVDDWGENPMYIKYVDTDGKEHIVKIRPAVTEQIYEILKPYAKISYVDEQDKKLKDELHTEITQGDESTLNGSKEYTDTKAYELSQRIETGDTETLETSKNYTDTQLAGYETKADAKAEHDKLSAEAENANKVYGYDISAGTWNKCNGNFTVSYGNSSITKLGYRQNNEDVEKSIDFTVLATKQQVTSNDENTLNLSKTYTDTVVNHAKDEINSIINDFRNDDAVLYSEATASSEETWIGGELPNYMQSNWNAVVTGIPKDEGVLNIGLITDNHFQAEGNFAYRSDKHYAWFGEATKKANVDLIVVNGDNINGDNYEFVDASWQKESLLKQTKAVVDILEGSKKATTPIFWIKGNHDTGAGQFHLGTEGPKSSLTEDELKRLYHTKTCRYGEIRDGDSLYFYKDFPTQKIRVIGLNTLDDTDCTNSDGSWKDKDINNHKLRQQQLDWLANTALKLSNEWHVIFFFHTPLDGAFGESCNMKNSSALLTIIEAFKNGSNAHISTSGDFPIDVNANFEGQGAGNVVAIFNGHYHKDSYDNTFDGINMIEQTSSLSFNRQQDNNTANEDAWDIISVDTKKRRFKMFRFGKGVDQSYSY